MIGDKFTASKAFHWLLDSVEDQIYFGELSSELHSSLCDDPAPYRKNVKVNSKGRIDFLIRKMNN